MATGGELLEHLGRGGSFPTVANLDEEQSGLCVSRIQRPASQIEQQAIYEAFETLVSTKVEELLIAEQKRAVPEAPKPQVIIQQQPLQAPIPTFDGSYASWPKFHNHLPGPDGQIG